MIMCQNETMLIILNVVSVQCYALQYTIHALQRNNKLCAAHTHIHSDG